MRGPGKTNILVINAGSSSIKYAVFDGQLTMLLSRQVDILPEGSARPGGGAVAPALGAGRALPGSATRANDHAAALTFILGSLDAQGIPVRSLSAAAHRVVHGGTKLTVPTRITSQILDQIRDCTPLAPLHNPHNIAAIDALAEIAPDLPQYASFDTGFHSTNPDVATRYAIPDHWHKSNIRRFGFHGISYQALVAQFSVKLPARLLAFHLGNGASICAIERGKSVATTMGYSPLEGLTMGTRSGSIDAGAVLRMAQVSDPQATLETLNRKSGLFALSGGISDMAILLATDTPAAKFAVEHFCYWAARHAGSMIAALGGVDAIAFTGGIGENAGPVRERITALLDWAGVPTAQFFIIPADEERQIAKNALALMTVP